MLDPNVIAKLGELKNNKQYSDNKITGYVQPNSLVFVKVINIISIPIGLFLLFNDYYRIIGVSLLGLAINGLALAFLLDNFLAYIFRISCFQKDQLIVETEKLVLLDEIANKLSDKNN